MALLKKLADGTTATWGTPELSFEGTIENFSRDVGGGEEPLPDGNGETIGLCFYDGQVDVDFDLIYNDEYTPPARGDDLEAGDDTIVVRKVSFKWNNKGWAKVNVKGTAYDAMSAAPAQLGAAPKPMGQRATAARKNVRGKAPRPAPAAAPAA